MKKIIAILLIAAMVFSLAACGKKAEPAADTGDGETFSGTELKTPEIKEPEKEPEKEPDKPDEPAVPSGDAGTDAPAATAPANDTPAAASEPSPLKAGYYETMDGDWMYLLEAGYGMFRSSYGGTTYFDGLEWADDYLWFEFEEEETDFTFDGRRLSFTADGQDFQMKYTGLRDDVYLGPGPGEYDLTGTYSTNMGSRLTLEENGKGFLLLDSEEQDLLWGYDGIVGRNFILFGSFISVPDMEDGLMEVLTPDNLWRFFSPDEGGAAVSYDKAFYNDNEIFSPFGEQNFHVLLPGGDWHCNLNDDGVYQLVNNSAEYGYAQIQIAGEDFGEAVNYDDLRNTIDDFIKSVGAEGYSADDAVEGTLSGYDAVGLELYVSSDGIDIPVFIVAWYSGSYMYLATVLSSEAVFDAAYDELDGMLYTFQTAEDFIGGKTLASLSGTEISSPADEVNFTAILVDDSWVTDTYHGDNGVALYTIVLPDGSAKISISYNYFGFECYTETMDGVLDKLVNDGVAEDNPGLVVYEKYEVTIGGYKGRAVDYEGPVNGTAAVWTTDVSMYTMVMVCSDESYDNAYEVMKGIAQSFEIIE